jgi:hypothetical protein
VLYPKFLEVLQLVDPRWADMAERSHLFRLPFIPHQVLPHNFSPDLLDHILHHMRLPFKAMTIEDQAGCTLLGRPPSVQGMQDPTLFVDMVSATTSDSDDAFRDSLEDKLGSRDIIRDLPEDTHILVFGSVGLYSHKDGHSLVAGIINRCVCCTPTTILMDVLSPEPSAHSLAPLRNAATAIEEVVFIEQQKYFSGWPAPPETSRFNVSLDGEISIAAPELTIL